MVIGFSGFVFGVLIHSAGIMMQYEDWLDSGMNEQNPDSDIILLIFSSLVLLAIVVVSIITVLQRNKA